MGFVNNFKSAEKQDTLRFETKQLHAGYEGDAYRACSVPVYSTASFKFNSTGDAQAIHEGRQFGHVYTRVHNPTVDTFERRIATLEGGRAAVAVASGSAAITLVAMALCSRGGNIVSTASLYSGTYHLLQDQMPRLGIQSKIAGGDTPEQIRALIDDDTKFIFTETVGNPNGQIADIEALAQIAHDAGVPLVVDNTFGAGGFYSQPISFGADIVLHSATKWICGHGTTIAGVVVDGCRFDWGQHAARYPQFHQSRPGTKTVNHWEMMGMDAFNTYLKYDILRDSGACLAPHSAQQLLIGMESLSLRAERMATNALQLAEWLQGHGMAAWVSYPGLQSHPSHELARKYFRSGYWGSVLTFGVRGGIEGSLKFIDHLKLFTHTANVGDSKSLVISHWNTTHNSLTEEERLKSGVTADLIRVSVGIEHIDDLKEDFEQAFNAVREHQLVQAQIPSDTFSSIAKAQTSSGEVEELLYPIGAILSERRVSLVQVEA